METVLKEQQLSLVNKIYLTKVEISTFVKY